MTEQEEQPRVETYDNGAVIVRGKGGRFLPGTRSPAPITVENSHALHRKRQEKTARLLREAISAETADKLIMSDKPTAAEAVAAAGGILWRDIVLSDPNDKNGVIAYPRDRLEAWNKIGERAGILATPAEQRGAEQPEDSDERTILHELARRIRAMAERGQLDEDAEK